MEMCHTFILCPTVFLDFLNFGGDDFNILCSSNAEYGTVKDDFFAEEITGEAINDARFNRNASVGDQLNVKIVDIEANVGSGEGQNLITQDVKSGTGAYDLAFCCGYATSSLSTNNYLYNIKNVPYINLEAPWWDQVANRDLQILDQLFYTTGDISTADNDATYCIMFNKGLIINYNLQNPYELVDGDQWTMDNFINMATQVHQDTNGNGQVDREDLFGVMIWDDSMMGIVNCTGTKCCTVNSEGLLELTLNNETVIEDIVKNQGATVMMVTHNPEIAKMADRVVKVRGGKIASIRKNMHPLHAEELVW